MPLRRIFAPLFLAASLSLCAGSLPAATPLLAPTSQPGDFTLAAAGHTATVLVEPAADPAVGRAAEDLCADIERVTGTRPALSRALAAHPPRLFVLAAVLGQSPLLDQLAANGKLDLAQLRGAWESFVITVVSDPLPGVDQALVIVGSDRRGAIFGCYEVSQAIGVSPWHWWADVPVPKRETLTIAAGTHRFGPPSVKYRGIFLNDEDWGLQPWAAKTFEPETGDIGPKTYAKLFELLLRLKANTVWPAMHPTTRAFNHYPRNKEVADAYGIVMGSSHAEPMLRNNVDEWTAPKEDYNYLTNRDGVLRYWEQRVAENGRYEAIYTLGMRGIHDSHMVGPKTDAERIRALEQVFADQRALLARHAAFRSPSNHPVGRGVPAEPSQSAHEPPERPRLTEDGSPYPPGRSEPARDGSVSVSPALSDIPQMFCAYKEVLDLYRQGLRVPDDVTIVWPDDNFGYIRNFATAAERTRRGGFGVYYHLSYLGRPLSYLWLSTIPPALIWEEMHKAYEHGADRIWIANVGDLKPAEIPTEFFLQMAWDIDRWTPDTLPNLLPEWAAREFARACPPVGAPLAGAQASQPATPSPEHPSDQPCACALTDADEIAALLADYYVLNFQRKPEHLQWWLPRQPPQPSTLTDAEVQARLDAFARLRARVDALRAKLPAAQQDAFYQLVYYPVIGSALANERFFAGERGDLEAAHAADARLTKETRFFNERLAGGKWRGIMSLEPADAQWSSMRIAPWTPPAAPRAPVPSSAPDTFIARNAAQFTTATPRHGAAWTVVPGLGRTGAAVTVLPTTFSPVALTDAAKHAPRLDYAITLPKPGTFTLQLHLLPTHPITGTALRLAVALDDTPPQLVSLEVGDGGPAWAQAVLDAVRIASAPLTVNRPGEHTLRIYAVDPGVVLDQVVLDLGGLTPAYLGPPASE